MVIPENPLTFIQAAAHYFMFNHVADAMNELSTWSQEDKERLRKSLEDIGYWISSGPTNSTLAIPPAIKPKVIQPQDKDDEALHAQVEEDDVLPPPVLMKKVQ